MNINWADLKQVEKKVLFNKYIQDELERNNLNYENDIIDNLTYIKNSLFLENLRKNKNYVKKLNSEDVIIKDNNIYKIMNIEKDLNGLFFHSKNFQDKKKMYESRDILT